MLSFTEDYFKLSKGCLKALVLIENILAAFEMEEILYELRHHCLGLNTGKWDYIFSYIKKFRFVIVIVTLVNGSSDMTPNSFCLIGLS